MRIWRIHYCIPIIQGLLEENMSRMWYLQLRDFSLLINHPVYNRIFSPTFPISFLTTCTIVCLYLHVPM